MASVDSTVELLQVFSDPTRVRLLSLLSDDELSVAELTSITELPQSRVSTHLGRLREAGMLRDRKVGVSTYYAINEGAMPDPARRVWSLVRAQLDDALLESDRHRRDRLRREAGATSWPDSIAGEMERHYSPGRTWEATVHGLLGLVRAGDVVDIGAGDGAISQLLAPRAKSVTCVDQSERLVAAARKRLAKHANAHVVCSDMHALGLESESFDQALMLNVLTYARDPAAALTEMARVLRPGGAAIVVTLARHSHTDATASYGHLNAGFTPSRLARMLEAAGLNVSTCAVTSRERRKPYFEVITACAEKPRSGGRNAHESGRKT